MTTSSQGRLLDGIRNDMEFGVPDDLIRIVRARAETLTDREKIAAFHYLLGFMPRVVDRAIDHVDGKPAGTR